MLEISGMAAFQTQVLSAQGLFLVDFWGPSCAPCIDLNRTLEGLEAAYASRLILVKVNADDELEIALHCGVRGLPTLLLIEQGRIRERWIGMQSAKALRAKLDKALLSG